MLVYFIFCLFVYQIYYYIIGRHIRDWKSLETLPAISDSPLSIISVIIPARNEQENIGSCIESVLKNNYSRENYKIFIINDHSDDNTLEICEKFVTLYPNVFVFSLPDNQKGKKAALLVGTEKSTGDIIFTLDADSTLLPYHLQSIATYFNDNEKLILTGPVRFSYTDSFTRMIAMELSGLMVITGAGYVNKWHHLANGTNMAYRRVHFEILGGYSGSEKFSSGDDMFLMNKFKIRYPDATGFLKSKEAIVETEAPQNFQEFFRQRLRWSTKNKSFPDRGMKSVLITMFLTSLLISVNLIISIWAGFTFLSIAIIGFLAKAIVDYRLIRIGAEYFNIKGWRPIFLPSEFFQIIYVVFIGITSLFKSKYTWKGRSCE